MNRTRFAIVSLVSIVALAAIGAAVGAMTPTDLQLPTHWGVNGQPDRYSDKWFALALAPLVLTLSSLLLYFLPALEPRRQGLERSQGLYASVWAAMLLLCAIIQLVMVASALDWPLDASRLLFGGTGAVLAIIGNRLGKSRSMYLIGIRTPWTLASEEVWIKTHRLAGKTMIGGGLLLIAVALIGVSPQVMTAVLMIVILAAVVAPLAYSYILWRREQPR